MKKKITEHIISIVVIAVIFILAGNYLEPDKASTKVSDNKLPRFDYVKITDPLEAKIVEECIRFFYPRDNIGTESPYSFQTSQNLEQIIFAKQHTGLSTQKVFVLIGMYTRFILIFIFVMILTFYGSQSLAIFKFVKEQQKRSSYIKMLSDHLFFASKKSPGKIFSLLSKAVLKALLLFTLFAPAYVIAYSIRTSFDTNSVFFMILLGILSNGLLISYTQKFYTFLVTESRKGYIQTARVKNLSEDYSRNDRAGIPYRRIFSARKSFPGHVFGHIFMNARYQYLSSLKEQASFLISGLVIIEMALNIQGHLCYELMQNILYENYQIVLFIVFLIFLLLKMTEIFCDFLIYKKTQIYTNIIGSDE